MNDMFYVNLKAPFNRSNTLSTASCKLMLGLYRCIPWPLLGLQFEAIKFLDPTHAEYIWRKLNIDDGLVVEEVCTIYVL